MCGKAYRGDMEAKKERVLKFTDEEDNLPELRQFLSTSKFLCENEEFTTAQMQRYLRCGYGTVCKVLDTLCLLCVIEVIECSQSSGGCRYRRLMKR